MICFILFTSLLLDLDENRRFIIQEGDKELLDKLSTSYYNLFLHIKEMTFSFNRNVIEV